MGISIVTEYPAWFTIFCLLAAFLYAIILYRKDSHFNDLSIWKLRMMTVFRFLTVFFLSFMILSPLIKSLNRTIEKPIIVFAQDNSESIVANKDSLFFRNEYQANLLEVFNRITDKFEVNTYTFGEKIKKSPNFDFTDKLTDFSNLFDELKNKYSNRNVGALIIGSDGIYNSGINPVYFAGEVHYPVFTMALGDTSVQKDVILADVKNNKIAFLGNKFPVQIQLDVIELSGINTIVKIFHNKKLVFEKEIAVNSHSYSELINVELEAQETGLQRYNIRVEPSNEEVNFENNAKDIVIDVIDSKQKILLLTNGPHPDIGAIKMGLEFNQNFEVESYTLKEFNKSIKDYNLVVLNQIPSLTKPATNLMSEITKSEIPVLYILGSQSALNNINNLGNGLQIRQSSKSFDETHAELNKQFALFEFNDDIIDFIHEVPPLISAFGDYRVSPSSDILFFQKIKGISTEKPLLLFNQQGNIKVGYITGEGIWRWRLYNYFHYANHDVFNELINKIVQYLALKVTKDNFVIKTKKIFSENEAVIFEAEVYNESFEMINDPEVSLEIFDDEKNKFVYVFNRTAMSYHLNAGVFATGDYSFKAKVEVGDKIFTKQGKFTVISINVEAQNTIADHQLLYRLAAENNGKMYYPQQLDELLNDLENNTEIVPISYTEKNLRDIINLKWVFFLLLSLLAAEWFMRKYFGSY